MYSVKCRHNRYKAIFLLLLAHWRTDQSENVQYVYQHELQILLSRQSPKFSSSHRRWPPLYSMHCGVKFSHLGEIKNSDDFTLFLCLYRCNPNWPLHMCAQMWSHSRVNTPITFPSITINLCLDTENIAVAPTALWRGYLNAHAHTHSNAHTHTGTVMMIDSMTGMMNECI